MQYREYGACGFKVSALGMGCMRLPRDENDEKAGVLREKAYEIIRYAAEHGVNYFDTAYGYHSTTSEEVLGEALDGGLREKVYIATKQPFAVMREDADIRRNLENTLKKLRTDYIDVYLLHCIVTPTWEAIKKRDIFGQFEKFRDEGLIKHIGFSYHGGPETFRDALAYYPWEMAQVQQNLLDVDNEATEDAIRLTGEKGAALVIMEPLRGGGLCYAPAPVKALYDAYPVKRSPTEWAFRHLLNYPEVSTILSGMSTLEQLKENIEFFSQPDAVPGCLNDGDKALLKDVKAAYESVVTIPCTACEYCMPCPQNVSIPEIFSKYNEGHRFEYFDQARRSYMFTTKAGRDASKCVDCGVCREKCPQSIDVPSELKKAHAELFGWAE